VCNPTKPGDASVNLFVSFLSRRASMFHFTVPRVVARLQIPPESLWRRHTYGLQTVSRYHGSVGQFTGGALDFTVGTVRFVHLTVILLWYRLASGK
jgi:hypothetical protein